MRRRTKRLLVILGIAIILLAIGIIIPVYAHGGADGGGSPATPLPGPTYYYNVQITSPVAPVPLNPGNTQSYTVRVQWSSSIGGPWYNIPGATVYWSSTTDGTMSPASSMTDGSGYATSTLHAGSLSGTVTAEAWGNLGYGPYLIGSASQAYTITASTVAVTFGVNGVSGDFTGTVLTVDATGYTYSQLSSLTFNWNIGSSHSFAYNSPLLVAANQKQYIWNSTSGLTGLQSGTIIVPSGGGSVTANYGTQYYVLITSAHDSPTHSSGWYNAGAFSVSVTSPDVVAPSQHQWVCTGYSLDGGAPVASTTWSTTLTGYHTIVFNWQEQWYVTIISAHDSPTQSSGWFNAHTTVSISVTSPDVVTPLQHQWVCTGWTLDGGLTQSGTFIGLVDLNGYHSVVFNWQEQFYLTVTSAYDTPSPASGWRNAGSTFNLGMTSTTVSGGAGIQYVFTGWSGTGSGSYSGPSPSGLVTMNGPITETASWKTQYQLTVTSIYDTPSPASGWRDAGSTFNLGMTSTTVSGGAGIRYVFTGWSGSGAISYTGTNAAGSVTMNGPITETAGWQTQYYLTVFSGYGNPTGEGWYDAGATATFGVTDPYYTTPGIRYIFTGWLDFGTGGYNGNDNPGSVVMFGPITETAGWKTQYQLTVTSTYDTPSPASSWYDAGFTFNLGMTSTTVDGGAGTWYFFTGWSGTGDGSYSGPSPSGSVTMNGPITETAGWQADTTPPTITAPPDITVEGNTTGGATGVALGSPTGVSDIVDSSPLVTNDAPGFFPLGTTIVTWTATDDSGNSATATQTVTVQDTTPPTITPPIGIIVEGNTIGGYSGSIGTATASDIVDPSPIVTNDAPLVFPLGTTIVTWTATDASGNSATATQTVTVQDTTLPTITPPADITVEGNTTGGATGVTLGLPTVSDIVDLNPIVINDAPGFFPLGVTVVTWTATDASGNSATASQTVTVVDTTPPTITPPADITVEANTTGGATGVTLGSPTVSDIVDPSPIVINDAPGFFPLGVTVVTWTATDASGNSATATQTVTVTPGALDHIIVSPSSATIAVHVGIQQYTAQGYDQYGNPIATSLTPFTWSVLGGISVGSIDSTGLFTAGDIAGSYSGVIMATSGLITGTASVTLTSVGVDHITVSPNNPSVVVTGTQQYTAQAFDQYGNMLGAVITWSVSDPTAGSINAGSGLFTAGTVVGSYSNVIVATSGFTTGYASVTVVTSGAVGSIIVTPDNSSLNVNGTQQYTAQAYDQYNNPISMTFTWSVTEGTAGSININTGFFTAGTVAGGYTGVIQASAGGLSGTASVTVLAGAFDHIVITPDPTSLPVGGTQQFTAQGFDQYNNPLDMTFTWSITDGAAGSIDANGLFTASTTAGTYDGVIQASSGGLSGAASVTLTTELNVGPEVIPTETQSISGPITDNGSNWWWWLIISVIAALLLLFLLLVIGRRRKKQQS